MKHEASYIEISNLSHLPLLADQSSLGKNQTCTSFSALCIIFQVKVIWDICGNGAVASQRRHYNPIAKVQRTKLERFQEGIRHCVRFLVDVEERKMRAIVDVEIARLKLSPVLIYTEGRYLRNLNPSHNRRYASPVLCQIIIFSWTSNNPEQCMV